MRDRGNGAGGAHDRRSPACPQRRACVFDRRMGILDDEQIAFQVTHTAHLNDQRLARRLQVAEQIRLRSV
jgi:hypothetical protein